MPRTIDEGFRDFLTKLTPSDYESTAAKNHRASIEACLKAKFGLNRFFRTGSFGNGTSISGYSDVDYFASIPSSRLSWNSSYALTQVREPLDRRFYSTDVYVDCPAALLYVLSGLRLKSLQRSYLQEILEKLEGAII